MDSTSYKSDCHTFLYFTLSLMYFIFQISSSSEAIDFLLELEKSDRNAVKYVVLDCPPNMAKVIVSSASYSYKLSLIFGEYLWVTYMTLDFSFTNRTSYCLMFVMFTWVDGTSIMLCLVWCWMMFGSRTLLSIMLST